MPGEIEVMVGDTTVALSTWRSLPGYVEIRARVTTNDGTLWKFSYGGSLSSAGVAYPVNNTMSMCLRPVATGTAVVFEDAVWTVLLQDAAAALVKKPPTDGIIARVHEANRTERVVVPPASP